MSTPLLVSSLSWCAWSVALFLPVTAVLHHAVFFRGSCMINPFGQEYTRDAVRRWLAQDAAPRWGALAVALVCAAGLWLEAPAFQIAVRSIVIGFAPLSLWIWDIPGSGRWICRHFHDDLWVLPVLGPVRTRHLYALSVALTVCVLAVELT